MRNLRRSSTPSAATRSPGWCCNARIERRAGDAMSAIRANIAANMAGQAWAITLALFCTPFYIKLLGVEAYGLIAFFLAVQMLLQLLDLGVGATVNREMARSVGMATGELGPFVKTVESWYRILGIGCAVVL